MRVWLIQRRDDRARRDRYLILGHLYAAGQGLPAYPLMRSTGLSSSRFYAAVGMLQEIGLIQKRYDESPNLRRGLYGLAEWPKEVMLGCGSSTGTETA